MSQHPATRPLRVGSRSATFQIWQALLRNRTKRHRAGQFLVHGVRPITLAVEQGWQVRALLRPEGGKAPSQWAERLWAGTDCDHVELAAGLLDELSDRDDGGAELLAVVAMPADDLDRLSLRPYAPVVVFDRPSQPGNIGTLLRSIDAFGGGGLVVTGHAADPYDPKCVRASTGSIFSAPTVRVSSHVEVLEWVARHRAAGADLQVLGTDEGGTLGVRELALERPTVLVIGNETRGLARAWREACDAVVSIPMVGSASSLNAATAGSILLHEALQQRRTAS